MSMSPDPQTPTTTATVKPPNRVLRNPLFLANILLIFALALTVRLLYWQDARTYAVGADEPDYVVPAQQLVRDGRYVDTYVSRDRIWTRVPGAALFFAGSFLFVPDQAAAGAEGDDAALMEPRYDALNIAQVFLSLLTVAFTMALAFRAFPRKGHGAAIAAGYISALYPPLASSPAQRALSEPLSIALVFAAILALTYWPPTGTWRRKVGIALLVGILLGVGALARSVAVGFVPFACLWFFWVHWADHKRSPNGDEATESMPNQPRARLLGRPITSAILTVVACLLAIAPWTYYNYLQYHSFLLLETANTTAYWHYHNFERENEDAILKQYSDPADRLSVIVSKGTENIIKHPDQAIGTSVFAFFYAWHLELNSAVLINSWDFTQRDPDLPDLLHTDAAFLLLGLAGLAGLAGVGLRRPVGVVGRTLLAINLWLLIMLLLGIVVPYDSRYRLPAAPALIILAAGLLVYADWRSVFNPRSAWGIVRRHPVVAIATVALSAWVLGGAYSPNIPPLLRSIYEAWRGDLSTSHTEAVGRYKLAEEAFPNFYWAYRHEADARREWGEDDEARTLYAEGRALNPDDPYGILGFADLAAMHPDWQLTADEQAWLMRDESQWRGNPWNSFTPASTSEIDVGTGRDIPYILGFYTPDHDTGFDYRWSMGRSHIRMIPPSTADPANAITLRMSAPAVGASNPMQVVVTVNGQHTTLTVPVGWADYVVPVAHSAPSDTLDITIESPTRDLSVLQPNSADKRKLGVGIDKVYKPEVFSQQ
ncbi:MAG TPA: hypothetical protein VLQ48_00580 [Chloroflexia bacterium]|nr:hypothetical protein [Chloroflexia bacterium]